MPDPFPITKQEDVKDTDVSWDSPHHTIGGGSTQAAAGNHNHDKKYLHSVNDPGATPLTYFRVGVKDVGSVAASSVAGPFTVPHGMPVTPAIVLVSGAKDLTSQSTVASIQSWDATNIVVLVRNLGGTSEACSFTWLAVG